jgi:hypothetical protein
MFVFISELQWARREVHNPLAEYMSCACVNIVQSALLPYSMGDNTWYNLHKPKQQ